MSFFDPLHLIKGIRNNFLTKDLTFENKICKWSDILDVYNTDYEHAQSRLLHKLNDTHLIPEKIMKMKVTRFIYNSFTDCQALILQYAKQNYT